MLEDLAAIRIANPGQRQVVAIQQEMEPDISVRGVDFNERLTFAEVAAGFGRRSSGHAGAHSNNRRRYCQKAIRHKMFLFHFAFLFGLWDSGVGECPHTELGKNGHNSRLS